MLQPPLSRMKTLESRPPIQYSTIGIDSCFLEITQSTRTLLSTLAFNLILYSLKDLITTTLFTLSSTPVSPFRGVDFQPKSHSMFSRFDT